MEPTAVLVFLLIWLFTAVTAGMGRSRRPPRGDWPRMPGRPQPTVEPPARVQPAPEAAAPVAATPAVGPAPARGVPDDLQPERQDDAESGGLFAHLFEPGGVASAVVLAEVIGPPAGRRPGPRFFRYSRRNRLYSGGGREGGAERGTDPE